MLAQDIWQPGNLKTREKRFAKVAARVVDGRKGSEKFPSRGIAVQRWTLRLGRNQTLGTLPLIAGGRSPSARSPGGRKDGATESHLGAIRQSSLVDRLPSCNDTDIPNSTPEYLTKRSGTTSKISGHSPRSVRRTHFDRHVHFQETTGQRLLLRRLRAGSEFSHRWACSGL